MGSLAYAIAILAGWCGGSTLGYLSIRMESIDFESRPWNWRALTGPWWYYAWLDRRDKTPAH